MNIWPFFIFSFILSAFDCSNNPTFVFLVSVDNSIDYLKHYGAKFGSMPNVEKMATEGVTFNHAFSNAPVCSVARSTLATHNLRLIDLAHRHHVYLDPQPRL